ncbi:MAG: hypothetical protein E2582_08850 [Delftia sp.]|nr:hypothetical protein [Delftia sp.]
MGLIEEGGKFYAPGASPSEVLDAFEVCKDLIAQMVPYCQRKLAQFEGDEATTARAAFRGLLDKKWCTTAQSRWVMRKTLEELRWQVQERDLLP